MGPHGAGKQRNGKQTAEGPALHFQSGGKFMTSNIPNYMAVKDLINCGVHEGGMAEVWRGREEESEGKTPEKKKEKKRKGK